jgi:hypothetical protein
VQRGCDLLILFFEIKRSQPAAAPTGFKQYSNIAVSTNPCGSWLASDGGVSGDIEGGCTGLIAGQPAPTGFKQYSNIAASTNPCGSWLASDRGVSGDIEDGCTGLIAGKPAPTGFVGYPSIAATSNPCADFVIGTG